MKQKDQNSHCSSLPPAMIAEIVVLRIRRPIHARHVSATVTITAVITRKQVRTAPDLIRLEATLVRGVPLCSVACDARFGTAPDLIIQHHEIRLPFLPIAELDWWKMDSSLLDTMNRVHPTMALDLGLNELLMQAVVVQ